MTDLDELKAAWGNVYEEHGQDVPWVNQSARDNVVSIVAKVMKTKNVQSLLDYGAGTGHLAIALKEILGVSNITVSDITDKGIDKLLLQKHGIDFVQASQPEEVGGKYDLILCWSMLHQVEPNLARKFLAQFSTMLNDRGTLVFSSFSPNDKFFNGQDKKVGAYSGLSIYASNLEDEKLFSDIGLNVISKGDAVQTVTEKQQAVLCTPERLLRYLVLNKTKL